MQKLLLTWLLAASPSSAPASSITSMPSSMPALVACAVPDAPCWARQALKLYDFTTVQLRIDAGLVQQLAVEKDSVTTLKGVIDATTGALTQSLKTISDLKDAAGSHWYLSPYLWFAVGVVATSAAVAAFFEVAHLIR